MRVDEDKPAAFQLVFVRIRGELILILAGS